MLSSKEHNPNAYPYYLAAVHKVKGEGVYKRVRKEAMIKNCRHSFGGVCFNPFLWKGEYGG